MVAFSTYKLGTVSVSNGGTTVTGDGVIWSGVNARAGDSISIDGGPFNKISDVTDDTHLELVLPAPADKTGVSYVIVQDSTQRQASWQQGADVSFLIGVLNSKGLLWYLPAGYSQPSDVTPALTADDGQAILKIDTGALWVMQGGSWIAAGTFKGFNYKGAYSGGTAYVVNDVVTSAGSTYIVTAPTTGNAPPNASYYSLLASKGDTGATGATGADATIAVGTVTGVAYGQPATVTNVGTPGAAVFDFEIPKGQDGTGTGDVSGPSSATDAAVAGFDGTTGKLIKELTETQVRSAAGASTVGAALLTAADEAAALAKLGVSISPQGRLTLTSATPIMTTSVAAATTLYYTPALGNQIPIYDGTNMVPTTFSELSVATTDTTKSPAAIGASKVNDWFVWNDGGTMRLSHGPDWTNDTTRSAGTALVMVKGVLLNSVSITNGPAASRGTYVGTTRSNSSSSLDWIFGSAAAGGGMATFGLWNAYNRSPVSTFVASSTANWTYAVANTWRATNGSSTMRVNAVRGLDVDPVRVQNKGIVSAGASTNANIGIGLDSTSTRLLASSNGMTGSTTLISIAADFDGLIGLGYHFISALELNSSTTSSQWFGVGGSPADIQSGMFVSLWQ
jgi:hypothetical protein